MRETEQLNHGWEFWLDTACGEELPADAVFTPVPVPHDWMIWRKNLYEDGTGWYRNRLNIKKIPGERTAVFFEGVYMEPAVYINGKLAGEWKYGYTSFYFDITDLLNSGENEILVRCTVRHPNSRWYAGAGIYRNVELWRYPEKHLEPWGLYAAPKENPDGTWTVHVQAEVSDWTDSEAEFRLLDGGRLLDSCRIKAKSNQICGECKIRSPRLWDIENPQTYQLEAILLENGQPTDRQETRIGFRTIELTPERGLLLNHKPLKLHGAALHHDLGCLGTAFSLSAARRQLTLLKEMGVNAIRTGHTMPAVGVMDLADEMGLFVVDESFDCWTSAKTKYDYARFFPDWWKRDVSNWVRRDRNHPSLLMWCIGNEIYDTHAGPQGLETTRSLMEEVRRHDPRENGKVTLASNYMAWENTQKCADIIKVVGYNYGEKLYGEHHAAHPDWIIYGSETGSIVQSRGIYHFPLRKSLLVDDDQQCSSLGNSRTSWGAESIDVCLAADVQYPYHLGQFIWSGIDYIGEPTPYHTKSSYFGQIDTAGFPKDSFYHYQAGWTDWRKSPMIHILPYWDFNEGQPVDICVISNAPEAELWVNGVSQGRRRMPSSCRTTWNLPYHRGELRAAAYGESGNIIAETSEKSFGDGTALSLACDKKSILADGKDLAFITITALDAAGNEVKNANNEVTVTVSGSGQLLGLDNGDSADFTSYKTSRRQLFSGKLLAVVSGGGGNGPVIIEAVSPGLQPACLELEALPCTGEPVVYPPLLPPEGNGTDIPARKIELTTTAHHLTLEHPAIELTARLLPETAAPWPVEWQLTDDGGVPVSIAKLEVLTPDGRQARVTGLGDGTFWARCCCSNGGTFPRIISQLEFSVSGMGTIYPDPYSFLSGSLYTQSAGGVGNGNERGVSTSRTNRSWVAYENLDFGKIGSDTVTIPIFELAGIPTPIRFWRGIPDAPGSCMIGERIYNKPTQWNVYQEETFHLDQRLQNLDTFSIELNSKVHIKGFTFHPGTRAWDTIRALDRDMIYGDTYRETSEGILNIGNNVSLVFKDLDFGETGCKMVAITGRTALENNSIHICFRDGDGETRRIVEFHRQGDWGRQTFPIDPVYGKQEVTFLFLPGSDFDFSDFHFE